MIYSVGIDFHKDQHRARCLDQRAQNPIIVFEPAGLAWLVVAVYLRSRHPDCRLVKAKMQKIAALRRYLRGSAKSDRIDALTLAKMPFIDPEQLYEIYLPPAEVHALQRLTRQRKRLEGDITSRKIRIGATVDGYLPDCGRPLLIPVLLRLEPS